MGWEADYDRWKTTPPEDNYKVYCTCDWCGDDIYEGEEYLKVQGDRIHEDCFDEYAREQLDPRSETADSQAEYDDYMADRERDY